MKHHRLALVATLATLLSSLGACGAADAPVATGPVGVGQGSLGDATAQFSQRFQCPIERVMASLDGRVVTPPPDVAADPARLAMFNQQVAVALEMSRAVDVEGCGRAAVYTCVARDTRHHGEVVGCVLGPHNVLAVLVNSLTRVVDRVVPGSLGERVGFRAGDVLVGLDHQPQNDIAEYVRQLADPGSVGHVVTVLRGGMQVDIAVPHLDAD